VIRESVLATLPPARRAELHAAAARALAAAGAPEDRIAVHLVDAPLDTIDGGLGLLHRAGSRALGEGDAATAARLLSRVADEAPGDAELDAELGRALLRSGRPGDARAALLRAAAQLPRARPRALALATAAEATAILEGPAAAVAELRTAREAWDGDDGGATLLDARLAMLGSYRLGAGRGWNEHLERFARLPGETADERTLLAAVTQRALNHARPASEVRELALRALRSGALLDDLSYDLLPWGLAAFALVCADGVDEAEEELARGQARIRAGGSPSEFTVVAMVAAQIAWRRGDMRTCENEAVGGMDAAILMEPGPLRDALHAVATRLAVVAQMEQQELDRAAETLRAFDERALDAEPTVPVERVRFARAHLALAAGDANRALAEARALEEAEDRSGTVNTASPWWVPAALALLRLGREAEARDVAERWLAVARGSGTSTDVGAALRLLARIEPGRRVELLEESVAQLAAAPDRLEYAAALVDYGEVLGNVGRRAEAREPLNRGLELAEACVARSLSSRAVEALAGLGDRPRRFVRSGVDELTASERRVARLAADGRTNREIAQELFVTPKTVENHLRHAYAKLGVAGRRELAGVLATAA
jgi:DNA-binding CsgD family transcriptional regulator